MDFLTCTAWTACGAIAAPVLLVFLLYAFGIQDANRLFDVMMLGLNFFAQVIVAYGTVKGILGCKKCFHRREGADATSAPPPEFPMHPVAPRSRAHAAANDSSSPQPNSHDASVGTQEQQVRKRSFHNLSRKVMVCQDRLGWDQSKEKAQRKKPFRRWLWAWGP